ncbi:hypothetical protein TNCV_3176231 [Trichonephila clavipes]|nr:hypothetical protein TNCV_3176231 [Trichonephila clavipes]
MQLPLNSFHGYWAPKVDIHLRRYLQQCIIEFYTFDIRLSRCFNLNFHPMCFAESLLLRFVKFVITPVGPSQWSLEKLTSLAILDTDAPEK